MKTNIKFTFLLTAMMLALLPAISRADNQAPTQTVCLGTEPYHVDPGNAANTFLWSITSGASGTDWTISSPNASSTNVTWLKTGTYTLEIKETDATSCFTIKQVVVTVINGPLAQAVTGGGHYCAGGTGLVVGLAGSEPGVNYQLQLNGTNVGPVVTGTGGAISFGNQTAAGTYTVTASTTGTTVCSSNMTGSVTIIIDPAPTAFAVTGGGSFCLGGPGASVGLSGSEIGVNYQLVLNGATNVGSTIPGTGSAISFGLQTAAGSYTVIATSTAGALCSANMTSSATITITNPPATSAIWHN